MPARLPAAGRRRQLLDAARGAFAEKGFHATSMDEVAGAAGVTKPVIYQHFGSKRQLFLELLGDVGSELRDTIAKASRNAIGPRARVEAGFAAYLRFVSEDRASFRLLFAGGTLRDEEFAKAAMQAEQAMAETIASMIDADISLEHRLLLAHAITGMADGVSRHWVANQPGLSPEELAGLVTDLAWAGLRGIPAAVVEPG
ncbi:MAG: Transcriptional regulator, AcrR family [uncultured Acidimicrobiales bacterium]|uniref:Transcriptional regulator, AcrR family n=1 Tax=uncultured Acidimicrobiales bacterium TaxID=310071 RepID=A0A6J4H106_9ACTN|nr:MAG: Transcriptional regulator, AcrR family [uncultured Acidimicrobiales bacterium]